MTGRGLHGIKEARYATYWAVCVTCKRLRKRWGHGQRPGDIARGSDVLWIVEEVRKHLTWTDRIGEAHVVEVVAGTTVTTPEVAVDFQRFEQEHAEEIVLRQAEKAHREERIVAITAGVLRAARADARRRGLA